MLVRVSECLWVACNAFAMFGTEATAFARLKDETTEAWLSPQLVGARLGLFLKAFSRGAVLKRELADTLVWAQHFGCCEFGTQHCRCCEFGRRVLRRRYRRVRSLSRGTPV